MFLSREIDIKLCQNYTKMYIHMRFGIIWHSFISISRDRNSDRCLICIVQNLRYPLSLFLYSPFKRNLSVMFKRPSRQSWQCLIYKGSLKSFVSSKMWKITFIDNCLILIISPMRSHFHKETAIALLHFLKVKLHVKSHNTCFNKFVWCNKWFRYPYFFQPKLMILNCVFSTKVSLVFMQQNKWENWQIFI